MSEPEAAADVRLEDGQPDWSAIDFDPPCPRCGYNLRGLTLARCPECGLTFAWGDVFDAERRQSDFLFEHHWRERPLRSWLVTVVRSLRPGRFWDGVSLFEDIRIGPLWFMMLSAILASFLLAHSAALAVCWVCRIVVWAADAGGLYLDGLTRTANCIEWFAVFPVAAPRYYARYPVDLLIAQSSALALVCGLGQSLRACRVRRAQVLRVGAYTAAAYSPMWVAGFAVGSIAGGLLPAPWGIWLGWGLAIGSILPHGLLLAVGFRRYLRLRHGAAVGLVAALVGWLVMLNCDALLAGVLR